MGDNDAWSGRVEKRPKMYIAYTRRGVAEG
ncbi:hypothetical protein SAMN06296010_1991 [Agreia pratensis]|uniref:Uncharacterized protein n=1 Tax=Agreia pratensis TaxID=150121 RepID=A0A1X7K2M0_9MICO|nr:hypothetical protein SAMN06296010_1991 [Agreia pratensis]